MKADDVAALLPYLTPAERAEVEAILASDKALWRAQPGPQTAVLQSDADIIGFGGSAGGGKSDLLCGTVLTEHSRSVLFRREKAQTERVIQRITELRGASDGLNSQKGIWQLGGGRLLELAGLDNPGDERRWQGRDHDLKGYDEVTEMREDQVRFTMGWNRTNNPQQRCRVLMTFNPPTTSEGRWVIRFFAPWLDSKHPNPAKPGELRWFTTIGKDQDFEVPDGRPFVLGDDDKRNYDFDPKAYRGARATLVIQPKSRTFIPSRVTDNPYYMTTGYIATLQSLPEPLRSQMLNGDFNAGVEDDPWQLIPTAWIDAAMERWKARDKKGEMDSLGCDVAAGGNDNTVLSPRHGTWFDSLIVEPGKATPDGPATFALIMQHRRDKAVVHIDVIGVGGSPYGMCLASGVQAVGIAGNKPSFGVAEDSALSFFNLRSELHWRMREALDPMNPDPIALPPDSGLRADLAAPLWSLSGRTIKIEGKEDIKKRIGRSPDKGDAVILALVDTPKTAMIDALMRKSAPEYDPFAALRD